MNYKHRNHGRGDVIRRGLNSAQNDAFDGRFLGTWIGRVTNIDDPDRQNRVRARLQLQQEDGVAEMETGWLTQVVPFAGPTNMKRGRVFGMDWPLPEVGSLIVVSFNGGNVHDGYWHGQPRYREGGTGAPRLEKDDHKDWALRVALQNGFEFGVDTEGNAYMVVPGNLRVKVQCSAFLSARGVFTFVAAKVRGLAESVMRLIAATHDQVNYSRQPVEDPDLREMRIDAMDGVPGHQDPGIGKIGDTE